MGTSPGVRLPLALAVSGSVVIVGPVAAFGLLVGGVVPATFRTRSLAWSAGLIVGSTVVDAAVAAAWTGRAADLLTALAVGVLAGVAFGGRR